MTTDSGQDYFVNKKTGSRTSRLTAKKNPDGTWETMEQLKDRLRDTWNVDEVECTYDEKGNCVTSPASNGKKAKRNRKSKERRKMKKAQTMESSEKEESESDSAMTEDAMPEKPAEDMASDMSVDDKKEEPEDSGKAKIETATFTESEVDGKVADDEPIPSEDGERIMTLSGTTASNIKKLEELFNEWTWDDGMQALKEKVVEEANELLEGGDEKPMMDGKMLKVIGTSSASEALTVIIVALKLLYMQGVDPNTAIRAAYQRHLEQYERYKHLK